jgi:hypothetical protein
MRVNADELGQKGLGVISLALVSDHLQLTSGLPPWVPINSTKLTMAMHGGDLDAAEMVNGWG